ncbi:MAG: PA2169 family four-helix-bundle protein [Ferruginibacter sp.]
MTNNETIEIMNDLVQINNDRIAGYEKAIIELKQEDNDLKTLFVAMIDESRKARLDLGNEVQVLGGLIENSTTGSGQIYRAWMDVKALFTGHSRHAILSNCHFGEDAAQKAYQSALDYENLPAYLRETITNQKQLFKASHDEIKAFAEQEV